MDAAANIKITLFKNPNINLTINYSFAESTYGKMMAASTDNGICYLGFERSKNEGLKRLSKDFPKSILNEQIDDFQRDAFAYLDGTNALEQPLKLHLRGTSFQLQVWNALLTIPVGSVASYSAIAKVIENKNAVRAVGTAIGKNPVAMIIPCHRVIQSSGKLGEYMWGKDLKAKLLHKENAIILER